MIRSCGSQYDAIACVLIDRRMLQAAEAFDLENDESLKLSYIEESISVGVKLEEDLLNGACDGLFGVGAGLLMLVDVVGNAISPGFLLVGAWCCAWPHFLF